MASEKELDRNGVLLKNSHRSTKTNSNGSSADVGSSIRYTPDLGNIIPADHDYIDLLVDAIKKEPVDEDQIQAKDNTDSGPSNFSPIIKTEPDTNLNELGHPNANVKNVLNIKTEPEDLEEEEVLHIDEDMYTDPQTNANSIVDAHERVSSKNIRATTVVQYEQNSNLSTLAEVSLATAGKFYEPQLNLQIDQARANLYPPEKHRHEVNTPKSTEMYFLSNAQKIMPHHIPTLDIPQSVKDAIIASATSSKTGSYPQNLYDAERLNCR